MKKLNLVTSSFTVVFSRFECTAASAIRHKTPTFLEHDRFEPAIPKKMQHQSTLPAYGCTTTPFSFNTPTENL